jgi:hypothetical protein
MYVYIVVILAVFAVGFFIFIMGTAVQGIQEAINPMLNASEWYSVSHFNSFALAATFVTNLWMLFPAFLIFGLLYWGWVYSQKRSNN